MCGIAGIFTSNGPAQVGWIKLMTDLLRHRGPDDEGFLGVNRWSGDVFSLIGPDSVLKGEHISSFTAPVHLFLGHRRLSILDLSSHAHQPMEGESGMTWVIYNGEIYNYRELRDELTSLGHSFKTSTDTEVMLAAYERWGPECLEHFNGMWAFVIYDKRRGVLFGARDRFGVKPFYYYNDKKRFAFASEQKALAALPFVNKKISAGAVFDYLVLNRVEDEGEGFFEGIHELPPSYAFEYDLKKNTFKRWRYYTLEYNDTGEKFDVGSLKAYSERVREAIYSSVRLRLHSDVPVGTCLSGGLDSSSIVCVIDSILGKEFIKELGERQKVFTASYDIKGVDESRWAEIVVNKAAASWHRTYPKSGELIKDLEDIVYSQDIPFGSSSIYAQYKVMKLAKENRVKVVLDGQGGDELFGGYTVFYGPFFAEMLKRVKVAELIREFRSLSNSPVDYSKVITEISKIFASKVLPPALLSSAYGMKAKENRYISKDLWNGHRHRMCNVSSRKFASLNSTLHEYMTGVNLKNLLRFEDRNSMRFSIESRTPFADDIKLIELAFSIPSFYKIHDGWSKFIFRESMKGVVPEEIRLRKDKMGFVTPENSWLNDLKDSLRSYMTEDLSPYINVKEVLKDWDKLFRNQSRSDINALWRFINFAVWKKVYAI